MYSTTIHGPRLGERLVYFIPDPGVAVHSVSNGRKPSSSIQSMYRLNGGEA